MNNNLTHLTPQNQTDHLPAAYSPFTVDQVVQQVNLVQQVMKRVMKEGEHYGKIVEGGKPSLLKPGAEKLIFTFRLRPEFEILSSLMQPDFISYTVRCTLIHIETGAIWGSGIGSCNSREEKYRWYTQDTGRPVPKEYWDTRDSALLGGQQYGVKKKDKKWVITEKIENPNPYDKDNTLLKMAQKRAMVAATLVSTAASDIFTQDVEEESAKSYTDAEYSEAPPVASAIAEGPPSYNNGNANGNGGQKANSNKNFVSPDLLKRMHTNLTHAAQGDSAIAREMMNNWLAGHGFSAVESSRELTADQAVKISQWAYDLHQTFLRKAADKEEVTDERTL